MTQIIQQEAIAAQICADELTEGDLIRHLGQNWQVINEPRFTRRGIAFEVLWLDVDSPDNTQEVCFHSAWKFELVTHQKSVALEAA